MVPYLTTLLYLTVAIALLVSIITMRLDLALVTVIVTSTVILSRCVDKWPVFVSSVTSAESVSPVSSSSASVPAAPVAPAAPATPATPVPSPTTPVPSPAPTQQYLTPGELRLAQSPRNVVRQKHPPSVPFLADLPTRVDVPMR